MTWMKGRIRLFDIFLLFICVLCLFVYQISGLSSVLRPTGKRKGHGNGKRIDVDSDAALPSFDFDGSLSLMTSINEVMDSASPIVVFRPSGLNATVVATLDKDQPSLIQPVGCQYMNGLFTPWQSLVVTGYMSDCRAVVRHLREVALNHTFAYDAPASSMLLANALSSFFQRALMRPGARPLACHAFLVDTNEKIVVEIDAMGGYSSVTGGVAGMNEKLGRQLLEEEISKKEKDEKKKGVTGLRLSNVTVSESIPGDVNIADPSLPPSPSPSLAEWAKSTARTVLLKMSSGKEGVDGTDANSNGTEGEIVLSYIPDYFEKEEGDSSK